MKTEKWGRNYKVTHLWRRTIAGWRSRCGQSRPHLPEPDGDDSEPRCLSCQRSVVEVICRCLWPARRYETASGHAPDCPVEKAERWQ